MELWQALLISFGGNAAVIAVLGFLGRSLVNNSFSKNLATFKAGLQKEVSAQMAELQHMHGKESAKYRFWHEQRVNALVEIYGAFAAYLRFLRRALYVPGIEGVSLDPYIEFRESLDKNLLFLDDELNEFVLSLAGEMVEFWNWAKLQKRVPGIADVVQEKLDREVPGVLERLRVRVNRYSDPDYAGSFDS